MGLFNDLFGSNPKKRGEAFGLFSYMNEQNDDYNKKHNNKQEDDYYYEDDE